MALPEQRGGTSLAQQFREQLDARATEFANALPAHVKPDHFIRAALTAIALNPKLLEVDRRSLINELMRCAHDGLRPDGREAVLVIYKSQRGPVARYQPMVAGIRKLVQQSGEITRFEQTVVYSNDKFAFQLGDQPHITHEPALLDRGVPILVYSIAQFKDHTLSREVMTAAEIEKVRDSSRAKNDGPWVDWWDEMARKTVAKRHAKVLPMSSDAAEVLANDNDTDEDFRPQPLPRWPTERRPHLTDRLDNGPTAQSEDQSGRQQHVTLKPGADTSDWTPADSAPVMKNEFAGHAPPTRVGKGPATKEEYDAQLKADLDRDDIEPPDFVIGRSDAEHGRSGCLNSDIKNDPQRFADWQRGFDSYKPKRK
jgi:recombination protein RecT